MRTFQSPWVWILLLAVLVAAVRILTRPRAPARWGFKDVLEHPEYWVEMEHARQATAAAGRAAQQWTDEQVAVATRRHVLEATTDLARSEQTTILTALGKRTHPTVLGLLRDPSLYPRLVEPAGTDLAPESAFHRACELLGDAADAQAVAALAPFLGDPAERIRKQAALAIASTGASTIVPLIQQALRDADEYVRAYALIGLQRALDRSGLASSAQVALIPDVANLLREDKNADMAAAVLYRLDSAKARELFLSPEMFTARSRSLHAALEVLADAGASVPRDAIHVLIQALEAEPLAFPRTYALAGALRLLGRHRHEGDLEFLRNRTTHAQARVAEGAAAGLLCAYGLDGFDARIWEIEKKDGIAALTAPQRLYRAVFFCDAEINNGGLSQYFVNSSGDDWQEALAGFEAMGCKERSNILAEAVRMFGGDGPSPNCRIRQEQLSTLCRRNATVFDALDSRYYKVTELVAVHAARYVLAHADGFR